MTELYRNELFKLWGGRKWLIVVAACIIKLFTQWISIEPQTTFSPVLYREYMQQLGVMPASAQAEYIETEYASIQTTLAQKSGMEEAYQAGILSLESYRAYMTEYYDAAAHQSACHAVYEKKLIYDTLPTSERIYYDDLAWSALFDSLGQDFVLYLSLLALLIPLCASEYSSGSFALVYTTARGRVFLYCAKLAAACTTALLLGLLLYGADAAVFLLKFSGAEADCSIRTVTGISTALPPIPIWQYWLYCTLIKLLCTLANAALLCTLVIGLRQALLSAFAHSALVIMPWLLMQILPPSLGVVLPGSIWSGSWFLSTAQMRLSALFALIWWLIALLCGGILWCRRRTAS